MRVNSIDVGGLRDQWDFNVELRNFEYTRISQVQVRTMYVADIAQVSPGF